MPTAVDEKSAQIADLILQLQQARLLAGQMSRVLKTSHKLVHALVDGNANDKTIGKYIMQTTRETDELFDQRIHKQLMYLLDKSLLDICGDMGSNENYCMGQP